MIRETFDNTHDRPGLYMGWYLKGHDAQGNERLHIGDPMPVEDAFYEIARGSFAQYDSGALADLGVTPPIDQTFLGIPPVYVQDCLDSKNPDFAMDALAEFVSLCFKNRPNRQTA